MKTRKSRMTRNKIDKSKIISDSKEYSEANTIRAVKGSEDESSNGLSTKKIEYQEEIISKNMDLFDKKEIEIFSLITLDKKNKTESEIEKRKIENKNLKIQYIKLIEPMRNSIQNIENIRKMEDEMLKKKREREDKILLEKRNKLDNSINQVNSHILNTFENIVRNVAYIRKVEDENINV